MLIKKIAKKLYNFLTSIYFYFQRIYIVNKLRLVSFFSSRKVVDNAPIIISLTSYYKRFDILYLVLESLFQQDYQEDYEIILYLSQEDIDKFGGMPIKVEKLIERGLQVKIVDENIRSYKKVFYVADQNKNKSIVTVDDDVYYPSWWLKTMMDSVADNPNTVIAYRGHYILNKENVVLSYREWLSNSNNFFDEQALYSFMPTGTSGVYYPLNALQGLSETKEKFVELCPHADDLWLKYITVINGFKAKRILNKNIHFLILKDGDSLMKINVEDGGNDIQLSNIVNQSQDFINKILSDSKSIH